MCYSASKRQYVTLVPEAGISGMDSNSIPQNTVGCSYLSLPEKPASGSKVSLWPKNYAHVRVSFYFFLKTDLTMSSMVTEVAFPLSVSEATLNMGD